MDKIDLQYIEQLNSLSKKDFVPLLGLIEEIRSTKNFGQFSKMEKNKDGAFTLPYMIESEVVSKFTRTVDGLGLFIVFNWADWDEGRNLASIKTDFNRIDLVTLFKLITAIVRNDRFCEGALVEAFESGIVLKIIEGIKYQVDKKFQ